MSDLSHQLSLLGIYRKNAELYVTQRAMFGASAVPQHIVNGLNETRDNIARIKRILQVYHSHEVADIPGIDYDDIRMVTITIPRDTYYQIKHIVEDYGIELPEVE